MALGLALSAVAQAQFTATATATVINGFVVTITVTDPGDGYLNPPSVTITGGGGGGAAAMASLIGGGVGTITVTSSGSGYTSAPNVVIGPPDVLAKSILDFEMIPRITIYGEIGATNQIQWINAYGDTNVWNVLTNLVLPSSPFVFYDTMSPKGSQRFYRAIVGAGGARPAAPAGFVWMPPGRFTMGSPENEQDRDANEGPQTIVTLSRGFFMGSCEVTQGEYQAVMGSNPSNWGGDATRPVESVSWFDAANYCARLTEQERTAGRLPTGWLYRLPTEAEWEYAARAGSTNRFSFGDDPGYTLLGDYTWYAGNGGNTTHMVKSKRPNRWGLYNLNGNVREWCSDYYASYLGGTVTDPQGAASGAYKVIRGGCWGDASVICRSANRLYTTPDGRYYSIGFRSVLAPGQ